MADDAQTRRLATIVALDVAGYSARTEADEAKTTAEVAALRTMIDGIAKTHGGRVFNAAGDGFMLEFGSSLAGVEAAQELAAKCSPLVRVGVHLGDVVVQPNGDLLGHGVNVAARLMARSDPGSALVSADVRRTIHGPIAERLVSRGVMQLDKMAETIEAFALAAAASAIVGAQSKTGEPLLAVLPFDNLSNDPEMQFFSDGVSEEILHAVALAKGFKVIGKASSFQFRGSDKSPRKVASELRATHMLDGSVRRSGDSIRVSVQLVDTLSQTTVWTARYDRKLSEVFALQDDIAANVATALDGALPRAAHAGLAIDPHAYELYLKARAVAFDFGHDATRRAAVLLEQVVALAPDFAAAWAQLGAVRASLLPRGRDTIGGPEYDAAIAAANRARSLDHTCAGAYGTLAMLKPAFSDHAEKMRLIETALLHAASDPAIASAAGSALLSVGRNRDAILQLERAATLDPMSPFNLSHIAYVQAGMGRVDDALSRLEAGRQKFARSGWPWVIQWMILIYSGRVDEAHKMLLSGGEAVAALSPKQVALWAQWLSVLRAPQSSRRAMLEPLFDADRHAVLALTLCTIAAYAGCADLAYEQLFDAFETGRPISQNPDDAGGGAVRAYILCQMFFMSGAAMRRDPRFAQFCVRAGLVDYWRTSGHWPDCEREVAPHYDFRAECEKACKVGNESLGSELPEL